MASDIAPARDGARHPRPPLVLLAAAFAALSLASLAAIGLATGRGHLPPPFAPGAALDLASRHPLAARWSAFLQLGAAIPLGLFGSTASSRLHFLGARAAGATITLFGGVAASILLAVSGAVAWALSWPDDVLASPAAARALERVAFAAGGPAHVEALGILLAGVAVTAGLHRFLPRWMMISGLAVAAVAELSWLSLVLPAASWLVPLARLAALAWLLAAGALLPARRRGAREASPRPGTARDLAFQASGWPGGGA